MPSPFVFEPLPSSISLSIGERHDGQLLAAPFVPIAGILKREPIAEPATADTDSPGTLPSLLFCLVRNFGAASFTLEVTESANNNLDDVPGQTATADAYAARSIRVGGADVAGGTLVVVPGGAALFLVEWAFDDDDYIKFEVDDQSAFGDITVNYYGGVLTTRDREEVP